MKTTIEIREIVPGLNGSDGLMREHYHVAKNRKTRYYLDILSQKKGEHQDKVIVYFYRYTSKLMDWDNMCASFKHIGDALVMAKIIKDDKPSIIKYFVPDQIKIKKHMTHKSVIIIEDFTEKQ